MRSTMLLLVASVVTAIALYQPTYGDEPQAPAPSTADSTRSTKVDNAPVPTPDTETTNPSGEKWRFRQHEGLWWYWLPSEKWVYWHEGKWVPYDAAEYAELRRSQPSRRYTYFRGGGKQSTNGYPELGQWGRVRYDGYGQRQYPYSRRNSGIRQLGPVPAMGGVRSLPGWGGER